MGFKILLANTRGMCAGVQRAIEVVEKSLDKYGAGNVYVLHEVVHNKHVVNSLIQKGATFVNSLDEIPENKLVIFSAHGVGISTIDKANEKGFEVIDATCPLVKRVHFKMNKAGLDKVEAVVIGHKGHQEVIGTIGQYKGDPNKVHLVSDISDVQRLNIKAQDIIFATQTTLSIDETAKTVNALKQKYPQIKGPKTDDTCFATQHRQGAVKQLAPLCDMVIVAGSKSSSNSNRLAEVARDLGVRSYLVDDYTDIDVAWLEGVKNVGLTAGASVPEYIVEQIIDFLKEHGANEVEGVGEMDIHRKFPLPEGL